MDHQQKPTNNIALNYGIISGILSVLISVIIYALGMQYDQDWKTGSLGIIVMVVVIFLGIKKFREFNEAYLTIGQALKTGIGIALISGIISVIYTLIFINFIEPEFMANTLAKTEELIIEKFPELTDEQIETQIEMIKNFSTPAITSGIALIASIFYGFVISLISGFILKKDSTK